LLSSSIFVFVFLVVSNIDYWLECMLIEIEKIFMLC
jgi:hypothetical protein